MVTWHRWFLLAGEHVAGEWEEGSLGGYPGDSNTRGVVKAQQLAELWCGDVYSNIHNCTLLPGGAGLQAGGEGVSWLEEVQAGQTKEATEESHGLS